MTADKYKKIGINNQSIFQPINQYTKT